MNHEMEEQIKQDIEDRVRDGERPCSSRSLEEEMLEMYLQGVSTRKVTAVTEALSASEREGYGEPDHPAIGEASHRTEGTTPDRGYLYLHVDATYLEANWGGKVVSVALLTVVGVAKSGHRELLAAKVAAREKAVAYRRLLRGLFDRGLQGVRLVISDNHKRIKRVVARELPGVKWQQRMVHFERNVLGKVPAHTQCEVAGDLKEVFAVSGKETADSLAQAFVGRWQKRFPKAVETFERGIEDALTCFHFPRAHYRLIRTMNGLERIFREIKRRARVIRVFSNEKSLTILTTAVGMRITGGWPLKRYLNIALLEAQGHVQQGVCKIPQLSPC